MDQMTLFTPPFRYIIDTCSILSQKSDEPNRRTVLSSMWQRIDEMIRDRIIVTCSEIKEEIEDDDIKQWLAQHSCYVIDVDDAIQANVTKVVTEYSGLINFAKMKSSADAFLIATAIKYNLAVITEEKGSSPNKIPSICESYGIPCYNIMGFAEKEGWKF